MKRFVFVPILLSLFGVVSFILAQADCPALVDAALEAATTACESISRNQACYGNILLEATAREDASAFSFEQAGDIVDVVNIETLQLSSMSLTDETWGIALMQIQANLPDTLPGQNVTILLFGNVQMQNAVDEVVEFPVTANASVNVRLRPTTNTNNVIASLTDGQEVIANGRLEDGSWVRVELSTSEIGWVSADFLDGEIENLTVVEPNEPVFGPMQAFYFQSAIGDRPCAEAPDSGILIQSPRGAGRVYLAINEVSIDLGSTIYVQAGSGVMTVSVLEGSAILSADGVTQAVPAGTFSRIPLDANGLADGAPEFPHPYDREALLSLPVNAALPQRVVVSQPVEVEELETQITIADGLPPSGAWSIANTVTENTCGPETIPVGTQHRWQTRLTFSEDRQSLTFDDGWSELRPYTLSRVNDNTYQGIVQTDLNITFTFTSATTAAFSWVGNYAFTPCVYIEEGTAYFEGG